MKSSLGRPLIVSDLNFTATQGHSLLVKHLRAAGLATAGWKGGRGQRLLTKVLRRISPRYAGLAPAEITVLRAGDQATRRGQIVHFLWGDYFLRRAVHPERCIFTLHQPLEHWKDEDWARIGRSRAIVTMAEREAEAIRARSPRTSAEFIPHGVDLDFWHPAPDTVKTEPKIVVAIGRYMRNFEMLVRVASELLRRRADVQFRWLVNPDFKLPPELSDRLPRDRFQLVRNLSAAQLRTLYQTSWLFFTPYNCVTASNAIVEAVACGCPVFTTHVAGMPSYGRDGGAVMVENNDDGAALAVIERALDDRAHRDELGRLARGRAEAQFGWSRVTALHLDYYAHLPAPLS